jgi:hypothetical protein
VGFGADLTNNRTGPGGRAVAQTHFTAPPGLGRNGAYGQEEAVQRGQLVGYRATAFKANAPSMLSGLGSAVNRGGADGFPDRPVKHSSVSDPAASSGPSTIPGYTGRRVR